jgi:hypothetical protein
VDIWGLCEVQAAWAAQFETAAEEGEDADFMHVLGTTGRGDRLLIIYDNERLELIDYEELHAMNPQGRVRSPLVADFRLRATGDEFKFMVNHLYRTREDARHEQSRQLQAWAEAETEPIIAVGDYNYDWSIPGGDEDHDPGYDFLTAEDVFRWLRPTGLYRTQYSRRAPESVLDFVFLANEEGSISGESEIIVEPGDFPDNGRTPDHRPILATLTIGAEGATPPTPPTITREELLQRLGELERQVADLRQLIEALPD